MCPELYLTCMMTHCLLHIMCASLYCMTLPRTYNCTSRASVYQCTCIYWYCMPTTVYHECQCVAGTHTAYCSSTRCVCMYVLLFCMTTQPTATSCGQLCSVWQHTHTHTHTHTHSQQPSVYTGLKLPFMHNQEMDRHAKQGRLCKVLD